MPRSKKIGQRVTSGKKYGEYMRSPELKSSPEEVIKIRRMTNSAILPQKKSENAAAFDLYALEDTMLSPGRVNPVRTGICIELPKGKKGEVYSRSGLAAKGISVANQPGKIDEDYRGEIIVLLRYDHPAFFDAFDRMRKAMVQFTKDFVSSNQFTIDEAKKQLKMKLEQIKLEPVYVKAGERIAQFEIQTVEPVVFEEVDELSMTDRGSGGLGSTGL